ncbi:MAG: hypothetical protein F4X57_04290 [Chloroflexi bacterium]|nr:hypothetical protein [Chloroflexota bacterium]
MILPKLLVPADTPFYVVGWTDGLKPTEQELTDGARFDATGYKTRCVYPARQKDGYNYISVPASLGEPIVLYGTNPYDVIGGFSKLADVQFDDMDYLFYRTTAEQDAAIVGTGDYYIYIEYQ